MPVSEGDACSNKKQEEGGQDCFHVDIGMLKSFRSRLGQIS
jgi:hypothetical protein